MVKGTHWVPSRTGREFQYSSKYGTHWNYYTLAGSEGSIIPLRALYALLPTDGTHQSFNNGTLNKNNLQLSMNEKSYISSSELELSLQV